MSAQPFHTGARWAGPALLILAIIGVLALELPWLGRLPFDAHRFRQTQTLSTIELFASEGIDLAHAKTNYVGEPGVFVLELPLFQALCAVLYRIFGAHTWIVRLVNLGFTFANAALVFQLARRLFAGTTFHGEKDAWSPAREEARETARAASYAAVMVFLLSPLNLTYMASTLLDPSATFLALATFALGLRLVTGSAESPAGAFMWLGFLAVCTATALVKTLYLFPTCVLLAFIFLQRGKLSGRLIGAGACVVFAVACFAVWLAHSKHVNNASPFTRDVNPTTLLGFGPLLSAAFYDAIGRRLLFHLAGPGGAMLMAAAVFGGIYRRLPLFKPVLLLVLCVLGYYVAFAKVNFPHDYYSIIIAPYAAMLAAAGAVTLWKYAQSRGGLAAASAVVFLGFAAAAISTSVFFKRRPLAPDPRLVHFQKVCEQHFDKGSFAMVFYAPDPALPPPGNLGSEMPEALYAAGLRGTGHLVSDPAAALRIWNEKRPYYRHLKYAVFFGLTPPSEIKQSCRRIIASDENEKFFACALD